MTRRCTDTRLTIPECSCSACTARLIREHAPDPIRSDPKHRRTIQAFAAGTA
jgi:hypothetical protein